MHLVLTREIGSINVSPFPNSIPRKQAGKRVVTEKMSYTWGENKSVQNYSQKCTTKCAVMDMLCTLQSIACY